MMEKIFLTGHVKEIDADLRTLTAYASTGDVDRDNEVIIPDAWRASVRSLKSVPLIWAHEYRIPPVGRAQRFIVDENGLKFTAQFARTEFAEEIWGLYRDGFLDSFSVGFQPKAWETGDGEGPSRTFTEADLLEISAVPVPSNPHARVETDAVPVIGWKSLDKFGKLREEGDEMITKRGRVLSGSNEKRIKDAVALLQEVLDTLGGEEPEPEQEQESAELPEVKAVIPYADHGKADEGQSWQVPNLAAFTDGTFEEISDAEKRRIAAHYTYAVNMPPETFGDLKLPHHQAGRSGIGPAVWRGVAAAMAALMGARGGVDVPDNDRRGIYNHLSSHYAQFEKEPPEFRAYSGEELLRLFFEVDAEAEEGEAEPNDNQPSHDESEAELFAVTDSLSTLLQTYKEVLK